MRAELPPGLATYNKTDHTFVFRNGSMIQLGYLPRLNIQHTSVRETGQIYLPFVNWSLFVAIVLAVVMFRNSSNLAAAYGIAVTGTMVITACMLGVLTFSVWRWPLPAAAGVTRPARRTTRPPAV